jgi:hypothetical protein
MKKLFIFFCILILSACGGGGSSSSGGGSNGTPGPTQFAGTYKGNLLTTLTLNGESVSGTNPVTLRIAEDGRVTMDSGQAEGAACVATPPPVFINDSVIPFNGSGTCFVPGIGACDVKFKGSIQMSSVSGVGSAVGTVKCGFGTAGLTYDIGVNKI